MFLSGFVGEFGKQLAQSQAEEADRAAQRDSLQAGILQHLATSDDPEIQAHAVAGLLDLAGPRKYVKGLGGFLGKAAENPALPTIRELIRQGTQTTRPEHVPGMRVGTGPPATLPGEQMSATGEPQAAAIPFQTAATPPPGGVTDPGDLYQPPQTVTTPRRIFQTPAQEVGAKTRAELDAKIGAFEAASPAARQAVFGHQLPIQKTTDVQGNVHFFQGGQEINVADAAGMPQRPTGPEAQIMQRSLDILATTPGLTGEQALLQARQEARAATLAAQDTAKAKVVAAADTHALSVARLQALVPQTIAAWQRVNGTTPMNPAQALAAARQTLGTGPDVTPEDVTRFADQLQISSRGTRGPVVSPTRAALATPLGATTPPPAPAGAGAGPQPTGRLTGALGAAGTGLEGASVHPRPYSAQGKQTIQALATVEPMLRKLVAGIQAAGLQNDNSIVGENLNKLLYGWGIDPGDVETDRLFTTGITQAYGLRGLVGGRSNQVLQKIYGQHLVNPGDSPKLLLDKAQDLLSIMPDIRNAVDVAEQTQVGARGKGRGTGAATAPPSGGMVPGQGRDAQGNPLPTIGETRVVNGITYAWDGHGWLPRTGRGGS